MADLEFVFSWTYTINTLLQYQSLHKKKLERKTNKKYKKHESSMTLYKGQNLSNMNFWHIIMYSSFS